MNLITRRLIAASLILIFCLSAPILILYTAGFRYNIKKGQLEKAGALVIKSEPSGARILLNNEDLKKSTPVRLNNIIPDEYLVSLEKENYYTWTKNLEVKTQETTFAEDIVLFRESAPELLTEHNVDWIDFSPGNKFAVYSVSDFSQDYLYLLNLDNKKSRLLFNDNNLFHNPEISWSKDDTWILFKTNEFAAAISTFLPKQFKNIETKNFNLAPTNFKWNQTEFNALYFQVGNKIYQQDILLDKAAVIYSPSADEKVQDYIVYDNAIYIIKQLNQKVLLTKQPMNQENPIAVNKTIELKNSFYYFDNVLNEKLALRDQQNNYYYLVAFELDKIVFNKNQVQNASLFSKDNLLLLQTDQELSFVNLNDETLRENTITRYSEGLVDAKWHTSSNYALTLHEGKISIIELDNRDGHFFITLPMDNISKFNLDQDAKALIIFKENQLWSVSLK